MIVLVKRQELLSKLYTCTSRPRSRSQFPNEQVAFNDEIRSTKLDFRHSPVGEQLEAADFVDHRLFTKAAEHFPHSVGDDKGAWSAIKALLPFKYLGFAPRPGEQVRGKKAGCRSANNRDFRVGTLTPDQASS